MTVTSQELRQQAKVAISARLLAAESILILHEMLPDQYGIPTDSNNGDLDLCRDLLDEWGRALGEEGVMLADMLDVLWARCEHAAWRRDPSTQHRCTHVCSQLTI